MSIDFSPLMVNKITRSLMVIFNETKRCKFNINSKIWKCSLESQKEIVEFLSNFRSFDFIDNVHQAFGYLVHHQVVYPK